MTFYTLGHSTGTTAQLVTPLRAGGVEPATMTSAARAGGDGALIYPAAAADR